MYGNLAIDLREAKRQLKLQKECNYLLIEQISQIVDMVKEKQKLCVSLNKITERLIKKGEE